MSTGSAEQSSDQPPPRRRPGVDHDYQRRIRQEARDRAIESIDLVAKALTAPDSLTQVEKLALLGRAVYLRDEDVFVRTLGTRQNVMALQADARDRPYMLTSPALCKLVICDCRLPPGTNAEDAEAAVDALYAAQLRLEGEDAPLERAREAVRSDDQRLGRHNARNMLREYERVAAERGSLEGVEPQAVWSAVAPRRPEFVAFIFKQPLKDRYKYGFAFYRTKEVAEHHAANFDRAWKNWLELFRLPLGSSSSFDGYQRAALGVYDSQHKLVGCMQEEWVDFEGSENDPSAIRRYSHPQN